MRAALAILWAGPWTLFGLAIGLVGLATGGHAQRSGRVLEFWGGFCDTFLRVFPLVAKASAVTFGHTVLARDLDAIERSREHERVHVRQYERWGPLFVPAYLFCSARLVLTGGSPYYDNPFEREAFDSTCDSPGT